MNDDGWRAWARLLGGLAVLAVIVARLGTGPVLAGLRTVDAGSIAAALALTAFTTLCCGWRWRLVAERLGVDLTFRSALAGYYRSQFLNSTLPGGVLGDVHRGVRHGREAGDLPRGLRAVVWERVIGQVVQVTGTTVVLLVLPADVPRVLPLVALGAVALIALLGSRSALVRADLRSILRTRRVRLGVSTASGLSVCGHLAVFLVAAHAAGVHASLGTLVPIALVVLLGSAIPINIAGWGPREGTAVLAFSAAGLSASAGLTTSVAYGVLALIATLPGALLLIPVRRRRSRVLVPDRELEAVHG